MLKSFWLNFVLTVAICLGGLCSLNAVGHASIISDGEETSPVGGKCTNVGCVLEMPSNVCTGLCIPSSKCDCRPNPMYDKDDPSTGLPCYCHYTP
jgi:hypothetical protein